MKNKYIAALFAILLWIIGGHKFYLWKWWQWLLYILLSIITFWVLPTCLWVLEGLLYLVNTKKRFDMNYNMDFIRTQREMDILTK